MRLIQAGVMVILLCAFIQSAENGTQDALNITVCEAVEHSARYAGQMIRLRGRVRSAPHDLLITSEQCPSGLIVFGYPESPHHSAPADFTFENGKEYARLKRYLRKPYSKISGLTATMLGRLDVTDCVGSCSAYVNDPQPVRGFGSPVPYARYQLLVKNVSEVGLEKNVPAFSIQFPPRDTLFVAELPH